jgi:hypothetical protein
VLGILAFGGIIGISALWAYMVVTVFLAARTYYRATDPTARASALVGISLVIAYVNQCYGDMGSSSWLGMMLMAVGTVCVGKLATEQQVWPRYVRRRRAIPAPQEAHELPVS